MDDAVRAPAEPVQRAAPRTAEPARTTAPTAPASTAGATPKRGSDGDDGDHHDSGRGGSTKHDSGRGESGHFGGDGDSTDGRRVPGPSKEETDRMRTGMAGSICAQYGIPRETCEQAARSGSPGAGRQGVSNSNGGFPGGPYPGW